MADETELLEIDEAEVEFNVLADERSALNKGDDSEDMWLPYMPIGRWWDREKNKKVARIILCLLAGFLRQQVGE